MSSTIQSSLEDAKKRILDSCKEGNLLQLKSSLEHLGFNKNENDEFWEAVMKIVLEKKNLEIAQFLMENGIKFDLQNEFYLACKSGKNKNVNFLIRLGADVNYLNKEDSTPLKIACKSGHFETVKLLLQHGADPNKVIYHGQTALMYANEFDIIEILLDNGANINVVDIWNDSVLTRTLNNGNISLAKYLIKRGANYKLEHFKSIKEKRQLLQISSIEGTKFLMEKGVNFDFELEDGDTPVFKAISRNSLEIIKLFLKEGVPVNRKNKNGVTALMKACILDRIEIVKYLIENGAETNARDDDDKSVMEYATLSKQTSKYLIEKGIFKQETLETRYKCIKVACQNDRKEFFQALIDNRVDLAVFDKFLHNPLQLACITGNKDIVNLLIKEAKVNINHRNQVDETALTLAKLKGKSEIVEILVQHGGME
jgi:ankyrin repeat protein